MRGFRRNTRTPQTTYTQSATQTAAKGARARRVRLTALCVAACVLAATAMASVPVASGAGLPAEIVGHRIVPHKTSALLEANINDNYSEATYHFYYATAAECPDPAKGCTWREVPGGSGTVPGDVETHTLKVTLGSTEEPLTPETKYLMRFVAKNAYEPPAELIEPFETLPPHLAPRASLAQIERAFTSITATSVELHGNANPEGEATTVAWQFEYAQAENGPWHDVVGGAGSFTSAEGDYEEHRVSAVFKEVMQEHVNYIRLHVEDEWGQDTSTADGFVGPAAPAAFTFPVHGLDGELVRVLGYVNPDQIDTHYYVQYVTQAHFEAEGFTGAAATAETDAGSGTLYVEERSGKDPVLTTNGSVVGVDLPGLAPGDYEVRVVASNERGVSYGKPQSVVVEAPAAGEAPASCPNESLRTGASAALVECRAFEQVTPTEKHGAQDTFTYSASAAVANVGEDGEHIVVNTSTRWGESPGSGANTYMFARTPGGWRMTSITPQPQAGQESFVPELYSPYLTQVALYGRDATRTALSVPFEFAAGPFGGPYSTAVTVPAAASEGSETAWVNATPSFSKLILLSSDYGLLGHATGTVKGYDIYEYGEGQLRQVNVLSDGKEISSCGAKLANGREDPEKNFSEEAPGPSFSSPHAISADGSHVFFTDDCTRELYMRVNGAETVDIGAVRFVGADAEGTRVLVANGAGEYMLYDTHTRKMTGPLFTAPSTEDGFTYVTPDFSTVYFKSTEQLTEEAPPGGSDIYRYDIATKTLSFIAQASGEDGVGGGRFASPDGRFLFFASAGVAGVPGAAPGAAAFENGPVQVYRYDSVTQTIFCMSCVSPFNRQPHLLATFIPGFTTHMETPDGVPALTPASANGEVAFFDTPSALVSGDVNGEILQEPLGSYGSFFYSPSSDVYEWRANGVAGCGHVDGCLSLITSGHGDYNNVLLGTTPSGRDVFFATHEQLAASDTDGAGDVYDARVGGGFSPPPSRPVECEGAGCASPVPAPLDGTPGSFSFSGPGNVVSSVEVSARKPVRKRCGDRRRLRKGRCVKVGRSKRQRRGRRHGRRVGRRAHGAVRRRHAGRGARGRAGRGGRSAR